MTQKKIEARLDAQHGVVARWQLRGDGISNGAIRHACGRLREYHDGVFVSGHAPMTERQRLIAAGLTTPDTRVHAWSAAWHYGLRERDERPVSVLRPGSGGAQLIPSRWDTEDERHGLCVRRSTAMPDDDFVTDDGLRIATPARTVLDLLGLSRSERHRDRIVRDALRLRICTAADLHAIKERHAGRRGVAPLEALLDRYGRLPADRAKSDAELLAVELLTEAGFPMPQVNVLVVGEEGDLVFTAARHIVELDSDGYHPYPERDERKQQIWQDAGWSVGRCPTDAVYHDPLRLYEAARPAWSAGKLWPFPS
jgi:hypothetical protein